MDELTQEPVAEPEASNVGQPEPEPEPVAEPAETPEADEPEPKKLTQQERWAEQGYMN